MLGWIARVDGVELLAWTLLLGFVFACAAAPLVVSVAVSPEAIDRGEVQLTPPCERLAATGEPCATCGLTRAFCAMSRLRVGDAAAYNGAGPWLYLGVLAVALLTGGGLALIAREGLRRAAPVPGRSAV